MAMAAVRWLCSAGRESSETREQVVETEITEYVAHGDCFGQFSGRTLRGVEIEVQVGPGR